MPLPTPTQDENRAQFISRCMSNDVMQQEYSDNDQRLAICGSQYDRSQERDMSANDRLLKAIQARGQKREPFAFGILTADKYVRTMQERVGLKACHQTMERFTRGSFDDALTKAAGTLTYTNPDMKVDQVEYVRTAGDVKELDDGIELPKNTLMAFRHTLTTPRVDRDGDILRTEGADVDPSMLLLWQHVHTLPIGKMLKVGQQTKDGLIVISAIVDINELSHDAAVMIDNKMGRFSHGFRALEFEELKDDSDDKEGPPSGFDVKRFEIMEESLVSVPSNVDAETEEVLLSLVEEGKLTSYMMKEFGKTIREKRPLTLPVKLELELTDESKETLKEIQNANEPGSGDDADEKGRAGAGPSKEADENDSKDKAKEAGMSKMKDDQIQFSQEKFFENGIFPSMDIQIKRMVGRTGTAAGHDHPVVLDDEGTGVAQQADGHTHKVAEFKVEPANGHSHSLDKGDLEERSYREIIKENMKRVWAGDWVDVGGYAQDRILENLKRGRSLSKANETKIRDAKENIDEVTGMEIPRTAKATLREASRGLKTVLDALGADEQESSAESITVKDATEVFLACATQKQRDHLRLVLDAERTAEKASKRTKQFRAFRGNG